MKRIVITESQLKKVKKTLLNEYRITTPKARAKEDKTLSADEMTIVSEYGEGIIDDINQQSEQLKEGVYINESLLDKYGEMVGRFLDKYGEAMEKMGFGKFIDKYGQKIDDKFGDFVMSCGRTIDDFIEEVHNKFKTKLKEVNQQSDT